MIKLIVSDVDGTLIQDKSNKISNKMFGLIEECTASGIDFAVASGRQYNNLKRLFAPVWEDIYFIPENGNLTLYQDDVTHEVLFPKALAKELFAYLAEEPDVNIVVSTPYTIFLVNQPEDFINLMVHRVGYTVTVIDDPKYLENEDIVKISVYGDPKKSKELAEKYIEKWGYNLLIAQAGGPWVDFSLSGKGAAVRRLADDKKILFNEIMVFGDNFNDEEMFRAAEHSYCMDTAVKELQKKARYVATNVEDVVEEFLKTGNINEGI